VVRVADNGVGISAEDLKRIGDPFFQAGKAYPAPSRGHRPRAVDRQKPGRLHGGEMTVQSRIDEGTTVAIALPLVFTPPAEQPASNIATLNPGARTRTSGQNVSGEEKCLRE